MGTLICLGVFVFGVGIVISVFNLMPSSLVASQDNVSLSQILINLVLGWFFGFAIASFQEETIFRGFLQEVIGRKFGDGEAICCRRRFSL